MMSGRSMGSRGRSGRGGQGSRAPKSGGGVPGRREQRNQSNSAASSVATSVDSVVSRQSEVKDLMESHQQRVRELLRDIDLDELERVALEDAELGIEDFSDGEFDLEDSDTEQQTGKSSKRSTGRRKKSTRETERDITENRATQDQQGNRETDDEKRAGRVTRTSAARSPVQNGQVENDVTPRIDGAEAGAISNQLTLLGGPEVDVGSDEEREIIKQIKQEISQKIRGEMKDEILAIQQGGLHGTKPQDEEGMEDIDAELRSAIIKMRKLDKVLERRSKKEREIKRERLRLQRRLRDELDALKQVSGRELKEVSSNTSKFLSLVPPPAHSKGITEGPSPPSTPVFKTQLGDQDFGEGRGKDGSRHTSAAGRPQEGDESGRASSGVTETSGHSQGSKASSHASQGGKRDGKDFIKRNIELAAAADSVVAMTDDEKKRISELLADLEELPEIPEEGSEAATPVSMNPYAVSVRMGEGFTPDPDTSQQLEDIDSRLRQLLPPDEFEMLHAATPRSGITALTSDRLFTRTQLGSVASTRLPDQIDFGEHVLRDNKLSREHEQKMKEIDERLGALGGLEGGREPLDSPTLDAEALDDLLGECMRTLSTRPETDVTEPLLDSESVTALSLYDAPPPLSNDTLQRLLEQARDEGVTSSHVPIDRGSRVTTERGELESLTRKVLDTEYGTTNPFIPPQGPATSDTSPRPTSTIQQPPSPQTIHPGSHETETDTLGSFTTASGSQDPLLVDSQDPQLSLTNVTTNRTDSFRLSDFATGRTDSRMSAASFSSAVSSARDRPPTGSSLDPDFYLPDIPQNPQMVSQKSQLNTKRRSMARSASRDFVYPDLMDGAHTVSGMEGAFAMPPGMEGAFAMPPGAAGGTFLAAMEKATTEMTMEDLETPVHNPNNLRPRPPSSEKSLGRVRNIVGKISPDQ